MTKKRERFTMDMSEEEKELGNEIARRAGAKDLADLVRRLLRREGFTYGLGIEDETFAGRQQGVGIVTPKGKNQPVTV